MPPFTREQEVEFNRILDNEPDVSPDLAADRAIDMFEPAQEVPDPVRQEFDRLLEEDPDIDQDVAAELAIDMFNPLEPEEPEEGFEEEVPTTAPVRTANQSVEPAGATPIEEEPVDVVEGEGLKDIGRAIIRGGLNVSRISLGTLTAIERELRSDKTQDFTQTLLGQSLTDVENTIKKFEAKNKKGGVAFAGSIIENIIPSITFGLAGAGLGGAVAPAALGLLSRFALKTLARSSFATKFAKQITTATGFIGARSLPFGASEVESTQREVEEQIKNNPNLTAKQKTVLNENKKSIAYKSGAAELGFETLGGLVELGSAGVSRAFPSLFRFFGRGAVKGVDRFAPLLGGGKDLAGQTLKKTVAESISSKAGSAAAASLGEAATEGATGFTQVAIREQAGLPTISKGQAVIEGGSQGAVSALFFRGALQTVSDINRRKLQKAIEDPGTDPGVRKVAVHFAAEKLRAENITDPQAVGLINNMQLFLNNEIDQGKDIKLDVDLADIGDEAQIAEFRERQVQSVLKETVDKLVSGEFTVEQVQEQAAGIDNLPGIQSRLNGIVETFKSSEIQDAIGKEDIALTEKQIKEEEVRTNIRADRQARAITDTANEILAESFQNLTIEERASIVSEPPQLPIERRAERAVEEEVRERKALGLTQEQLAQTIIDRNTERFLAVEKDIKAEGEPQRGVLEVSERPSEADLAETKAADEKVAKVDIPTKKAEKAPTETASKTVTKTDREAQQPLPVEEAGKDTPDTVQPEARSIQEVRDEATQLGVNPKGPKQAIAKRIDKVKAAQEVLQNETPESLSEKSATQVRKLAKDLNLESTGDIKNVRKTLETAQQSQTSAARGVPPSEIESGRPGVAETASVVRPSVREQSPAAGEVTDITAPSLEVKTEGLSPEQVAFVNETPKDTKAKITNELREQLTGLGLSSGGKRSDIIARLDEAKDEILARQGLRVEEESGRIVEDRPLTREEFDQEEGFGDLGKADLEALADLDEEVSQGQVAQRGLEDDISFETKQVEGVNVEQSTFGSEEAAKGLDDKQLGELQSKPKGEPKKAKKKKQDPVKRTTPEEDITGKVKVCE